MGLADIDTTRALRTPGELAALVEAVRSAGPPEQETHWLEWKGAGDGSEVDLGAKKWQAKVAKFILGAANRCPAVSNDVCGGCAYMVLGAEPGNVTGCRMPDSAQLDDGLRRFLGTDGPRYGVNSVVVSEKTVGIVTVEPTPPGLRPYVAQREYTDERDRLLRNGGIYIRRSGLTTEADAAEVQEMFNAVWKAAAASAPEWELSVDSLVLADLVTVDFDAQAVNVWAKTERDELTGGLLPRDTPHAEAFALAGETRTRDQFYAEVDAYIEGAERALPTAMMARLEWARLARLALVARNGGEDSLPSLVLELELPVGWAALGWSQDLDPSERTLPARPRRYGDIASIMEVAVPRPGGPPPHSGVCVRENAQGRHVEFPPIDVPQRRSTQTTWITLLVPKDADRPLATLQWWGHSPTRRGIASGELALAISDDVLSIADVLALDPAD